MKKFEFTGDWEIKLNLESFIESNLNWGENQKRNIGKDLIELKIIDKKNYDPDPHIEQMNSIEYIVNNQERVLEDLCKSFNTINKKYGEYCGEHDWYPDILTITNLGSIFFISEIAILVEHKNERSYIQFTGEYAGDYEHGLTLAMHDGNLLGFNQQGEDVYDEIYNNLGDERYKFRDFNIAHQEFGKNQVHQPLPKYGKHKPWQILATEEHLENLIRSNKDEEFINEFKESKLDVNFRFPFNDRTLAEIAVTHKNITIINYLIKNGAIASNSLIKCTYRDSFNRDIINCLINNGISIDTITYQGMTSLGLEVKNFIWHIGSLTHYKKGDSRIESTHTEIEKARDKIKFYIEAGANPNKIDNQGNDYKSILPNHHDQNQLEKHKAYIDLENIINPEKPNTNRWKFWNN